MPRRANVITTDAEIDAAIRRARAFSRYDQLVVRATYSTRTRRLSLRMKNGAVITIPAKLLQGLAGASSDQVRQIELLGNGTGLYWPALDVAHSVSGLLAGIYGSARWMEQLQEQAGARRIPA